MLLEEVVLVGRLFSVFYIILFSFVVSMQNCARMRAALGACGAAPRSRCARSLSTKTLLTVHAPSLRHRRHADSLSSSSTTLLTARSAAVARHLIQTPLAAFHSSRANFAEDFYSTLGVKVMKS